MKKEDYTRITTVLGPFAGYGMIPKDILAAAADRGTRTHAAINTVIAGLGDWIDEDIAGYVDSARHFLPYIGKILFHEERFYHDVDCLTGQVDLIAEIDGKVTLIDWKTSSKQNPTWMAQAGGYRYIIPKEIKIDESIFIKLDKKGGKPEFYPISKIDYAEREFKILLECYNKYFRNIKLEVIE